MKEFLKIVAATVVGLIITGVIISIVGIIGMAGFVAAASGQSETVVPEDAVFVLELNSKITERHEASPIDKFTGGANAGIGLDDILSSIQKAKENEDIKGIYLNPGDVAAAPATLTAIRRALVDFKKSGKFLVAYAGNYSQSGYYLATAADTIMLNPEGSIGWHGMSMQTLFYADLMKKVGVRMQVFKVGTYKSAVEPYLNTKMSDANREQSLAYIQSVWNQVVADVSASRKLPADTLNAQADKYMDLQTAGESVRAKMVDMLLYEDSVLSYLKKKTGIKPDDKLHTLDLEAMANVKRNTPKSKSGKTIAVYYAVGGIDPGKTSYGQDKIDSKQVMKDLRDLREDKDVKAVVLRVNSPGGSAFGSELIWREICLLKEKKPVVVSMGDYAASGGYYISCAADWIVAEPTTLTGSIGIFGMFPDPSELMNEKLGIHMDGVKTNKLSDLGFMGVPFGEEGSALVQQMINKGYETFTKRCADGRKVSVEEIKKVAEGRVWTGEQAKKIKLVDELGGLDAAIRVAAKRAKVEDYTLQAYPGKSNLLTNLMQSTSDRYIHGEIRRVLGDYYTGFEFVKNLNEQDRIQARLPFELIIR